MSFSTAHIQPTLSPRSVHIRNTSNRAQIDPTCRSSHYSSPPLEAFGVTTNGLAYSSYTGCPIKKATQAFGSCSRTRVPILFKVTMDIVWKMAKIIVTKANSLGVLPHLECVWLRRLHFCCFHWTRRSFPKKFSWDHPKTRLDFEKCPEQKDRSLRTPFASNYDRNRLWDVRQGCQPPPFGGPWACPRWSAGSGPTSSAFFKSLLRVIHKIFMLITYITCFAIYLGTQQCVNFYFQGNISSFMAENNSSRFFWTPGSSWMAFRQSAECHNAE